MNFLLYVGVICALIGAIHMQSHDKKKLNENDKRLALECVKSVKSGDYEAANTKLNEIINDNNLWLIVSEVLKNSHDHYNSLLKFSETVKSVRRRFLIYKILYRKFESFNCLNIMQLISLARHAKAFDSMTSLYDAKELIYDLNDAIARATASRLTDEIMSGYARFSDDTLDILKQIQTYNAELNYNIIKLNIHEIIYDVRVERIVYFYENGTNLPIRALCILGTYEALKPSNHAYDSSQTYSLALALKRLIEHANYEKEIATHVKRDIEIVRKSFTECVRNIVFAKQSCIKSVKFNEYFYSPKALEYDKERRRVFTWIPGNKGTDHQESWIFEPHNGNFYIKNVQNKEYLYPGDGFFLDKDRRRVFTWIPGSYGAKEQEVWQLELYGDYCFIKSVYFDEYLYPLADTFNYDKQRREISTWVPKGCNDQCLWKIEDCSP